MRRLRHRTNLESVELLGILAVQPMLLICVEDRLTGFEKRIPISNKSEEELILSSPISLHAL